MSRRPFQRKTRRPKTTRVPKTRAGGEWTEAAYWSFIRSLLRQGSIRWPPRTTAKLKFRRPSQSANKRLKWEYQCGCCQRWWPDKEIEVDHVYACGTLKSYDDLPRFVQRLFCEPEELVVLCKECHQGKTNKDRGL